MDSFNQRKTSILSKQDKSHIGKWDKKVISLCNKINKSENYYTTSSCSGRAVIMIEQEKKSSNLFLKVWHDLIDFKELKSVLLNLSNQKSVISITNSERKIMAKSDLKQNKYYRTKQENLIKFKCEPPILHIVCRDLKSASELLEKAKISGFKHSGIHVLKKNILLELNGPYRLEFPIINKEKILVSDDFLKLIAGQTNDKLKKGWLDIQKLEKCL